MTDTPPKASAHPAVLRDQADRLRSLAAAAQDEISTTRRSRDYSPEGARKRITGYTAPVGRHALDLLQEAQQALHTVRRQRAALEPVRSTNAADLQHAERTLAMLHQLDDGRLHQALGLPAVRAIVGAYATPIDEMLLQPKLTSLQGTFEQMRQDVVRSQHQRTAARLDEHENELLNVARDAAAVAAAAQRHDFGDVLSENGIVGEVREQAEYWVRRAAAERPLAEDPAFNATAAEFVDPDDAG